MSKAQLTFGSGTHPPSYQEGRSRFEPDRERLSVKIIL